MSMQQLALTVPCGSYLMKTGGGYLGQSVKNSYPRRMSMQLAFTEPCGSYLMKTGETN